MLHTVSGGGKVEKVFPKNKEFSVLKGRLQDRDEIKQKTNKSVRI